MAIRNTMTLLGILAIALLEVAAKEVWLNNVPCYPYQTPLETDPVYRNLYPSTVMIHRCLGSFGGNQLKCSAKTTENLAVKVYKLQDMTEGTVPMVNHTSCQQVCPIGPESCNKYQKWNPNICKCDCPKQASNPCHADQLWDSNNCQCYCKTTPASCGVNKKWDEPSCKCKCIETKELLCCKGTIDADSCKCEIPTVKGQ